MTTSVDRSEGLVERLFGATIDALELYWIYLGAELGLYRALGERGPATSSQLAERAGIAERYAREWLEQQAGAGLLAVDDAGAPPTPVATRSTPSTRACSPRPTTPPTSRPSRT
jgi:winged helix-turn-helix protein